jgi:hypothetical protein
LEKSLVSNMLARLFVLLLVASAGAVTVTTPYLSLLSHENAVRVTDSGETVWVAMEAGGRLPVEATEGEENVALTVDDVSCRAEKEMVTCHLPPTGSLTASGRLYQNGTQVVLVSETYRVSVTCELAGGEWKRDIRWEGTAPVLTLRIDEQSPEQRKERVGKGALCFLITIPVMMLAELGFVLVGV